MDFWDLGSNPFSALNEVFSFKFRDCIFRVFLEIPQFVIFQNFGPVVSPCPSPSLKISLIPKHHCVLFLEVKSGQIESYKSICHRLSFGTAKVLVLLYGRKKPKEFLRPLEKSFDHFPTVSTFLLHRDQYQSRQCHFCHSILLRQSLFHL